MGLADRDYMRERHQRRSFNCGSPGVREYLIAAVIMVLGTLAWLTWSTTHAFEEGSLRVNLNTASQAELESVRGIGPARARAIMVARPYQSIGDLERVSGISRRQAEAWAPLLTVSEPTGSLDARPLFERVLQRAMRVNVTTLLYLGISTFALAYLLQWGWCWRRRVRGLHA